MASKCTALIVEDDADIRQLLRYFLESEGISVAEASDAFEALEYLRRSPSPGLILLDLQLPGIDGWEFSRRLRSDSGLARIPIVVLSAHRHPETYAAGIPAFAYLEKPIELDHLLRTVKRVCSAA